MNHIIRWCITKQPFTFAIILFSVLSFSCMKEKDFQGIVSTDKTKPGIVTDVKVTNINGAALITYTSPNSDNLLYVMAEYSIRDGKTVTTKATYFTDTLKVEGFKEAKEYEVKLYAVSRAEVKSDPVIVKVNPNTPVYKLVRNTLRMDPTYSGVRITGTNPDRVFENIVLLHYDKIEKKFIVVDQHFRDDSTISYPVRGFDTTAHQFGVFVSDKWGNVSDTLIKTLNPLYDELMDKSKFAPLRMANTDATLYTASGGWGPVEYMWDNNTGTGWHTAGNTSFPINCTFDMGISSVINHFIIWERYDDWSWKHNNPKSFTLWGRNDAPTDVALPMTAKFGDNVGGWINLGTFDYPYPPSGNPITNITESDKQFVKDGVDFDIPGTCPMVRYMRVSVTETWGGSSDAHITELNFFHAP